MSAVASAPGSSKKRALDDDASFYSPASHAEDRAVSICTPDSDAEARAASICPPTNDAEANMDCEASPDSYADGCSQDEHVRKELMRLLENAAQQSEVQPATTPASQSAVQNPVPQSSNQGVEKVCTGPGADTLENCQVEARARQTSTEEKDNNFNHCLTLAATSLDQGRTALPTAKCGHQFVDVAKYPLTTPISDRWRLWRDLFGADLMAF